MDILKFSSDTINEIAAAMAKAQGQYKPLVATEKGNRGVYACLDDILLATREALSSNGIQFLQTTIYLGIDLLLITRLQHASGQWVQSWVNLRPELNKNLPIDQAIGSAMTYNKRYQAKAILGIDDRETIDVDQIRAHHEEGFPMKHKPEQVRHEPVNLLSPKVDSTDLVTPEQLDQLHDELDEDPDLCVEILKKLQLDSLSKMPKALFKPSIIRIREIKATKGK
jgi:ERF superfamily protein